MLSCHDASAMTARLADQSLDDDARRELEAHLAGCEACQREAEAQVAVAGVLRSRPVLAPSPGFTAAVSGRIRHEVGWLDLAEWRVWTWRLAPVAAGLLLAAFLVSGTGSSSTVSRAAAPGTSALLAAPGATSAESVFWDGSASDDQVLLTVLTGQRPSSSLENRHE